MYSTYAIFNISRNKIYIGHTENINNRLLRHNGILRNKSRSFTNRNKGSWELFYKEEFQIRKEAIKREKELKSYQGRNFLRELLKNKE
jgi:putative endonuclease